MNEKGYITPSVRKKQITNMDYSYNTLDYLDIKPSWTNGTVTDILMNENYTGTYVFNMQPKTEVGGTKARFLPKEEWDSRKFKEGEKLWGIEVAAWLGLGE